VVTHTTNLRGQIIAFRVAMESSRWSLLDQVTHVFFVSLDRHRVVSKKIQRFSLIVFIFRFDPLTIIFLSL
jgi:hypothetical protein